MLKELESNACFDEFVADQIMPFAAVAKGVTRYTTSNVTLHQKSNAYVINQFLGDVIDIDEGKGEVVVRGVGLLA